MTVLFSQNCVSQTIRRIIRKQCPCIHVWIAERPSCVLRRFKDILTTSMGKIRDHFVANYAAKWRKIDIVSTSTCTISIERSGLRIKFLHARPTLFVVLTREPQQLFTSDMFQMNGFRISWCGRNFKGKKTPAKVDDFYVKITHVSGALLTWITVQNFTQIIFSVIDKKKFFWNLGKYSLLERALLAFFSFEHRNCFFFLQSKVLLWAYKHRLEISDTAAVKHEMRMYINKILIMSLATLSRRKRLIL